jgi:gas vesicle protein
MAKRNVLKGLLGGLLVGAATALLLAPKKGSELRNDIRSTGEAALTKTKNLGSTVKGLVTGKSYSVSDHEQE